MKQIALSKLKWLLLLLPIFITAFILSKSIFASDPTPIRGSAKAINTGGVLDFSENNNSNVTISDPDVNSNNIRTLTGFAWSQDLGWVDFSNITVNHDDGNLNGTAYVENTRATLDFNNYNNDAAIDPITGKFLGNVWSEDIGWIDFTDTGVYVKENGSPLQPTVLNGYSNEAHDLQIESSDTQYYNYSQPSFEWIGASDIGDSSGYVSGVAGYYVYFGSDESAIPLTHGSFQEESLFAPNNLISGTTYYLRIQTIDNVGNIYTNAEEDYTFFKYKYDSQAPTNPVGISSPQTYQNNVGNISLYWAVTGTAAAQDPLSGVKGYQYRIGENGIWYGSDHTGNQDCNDLITTGSYTLNPEYDSLSMGENTFYLRTWDNSCNVTETLVTAILKYSGSAPSEPRNLVATPQTNIKNEFAFTWEAPLTYSGLESGLSYCYSINTLPSPAVCNWVTSLSLPKDAYATQPTTNTIYVVAKDEAGNVNYSSYAMLSFSANTSAPSIPLNIESSDVSVKATKSWKIVVSWEKPESVGAGIKYYQVYKSTDGQNYTLGGTTADISYVNVGLEQKTHYYKVKACDSANNCSAFTQPVSMYPDGKYTEPASLLSQPMITNISTRKGTINWITDRECDTRVQYGTKSGEYLDEEIANSNFMTLHSINISSLDPDTIYYVRAKWMDEDGNLGTSNEISFRTLPKPSVSDSQISKIGLDYAILDMTLVGADKAQIVYGKTASYGGIQEVNTSPVSSKYSVILSNLEDGTTYHYKIKLIDNEGYSYDSIEDHTFTTPPRPKISNVRIEEQKGVASPTVRFTWESNTSISSIITYKEVGSENEMDQINLKLSNGLHSMDLTELKPETQYEAIVEGIDNMGNRAISDKVTFTTATDTRPPIISNVKVMGDLISRSIQGDKSRSAQLIVTWDTDEPSTSHVEYGEGSLGNYTSSTSISSEIRTKHSVIISNLSPSKVYNVNIVSEDIAGNQSEKGPIITITPKNVDTVFENVINSLSSVFSFLK